MSEELRLCPFCDVNEWKYQSHFSGTTIYQCEKCGTIVEESVINTRPIEDEFTARIAELEHRNKVLEDACEMLRKENGRVTQLLDFWKGLSTNGSKVQESEATACKFCGSNESDRRMNSIVCSGCGRKIGNVAPPEVQE